MLHINFVCMCALQYGSSSTVDQTVVFYSPTKVYCSVLHWVRICLYIFNSCFVVTDYIFDGLLTACSCTIGCIVSCNCNARDDIPYITVAVTFRSNEVSARYQVDPYRRIKGVGTNRAIVPIVVIQLDQCPVAIVQSHIGIHDRRVTVVDGNE